MNQVTHALCMGLITLCITTNATAQAIERRTPPIAADALASTTATTSNAINRGNLGFEILGGSIGLAVGAGAIVAVLAEAKSAEDTDSGSDCGLDCAVDLLGLGLGLAPLLITGGVVAAGAVTGSNGTFFATWGGTFLGMWIGGLLSLPFTRGASSDTARTASFSLAGAGGLAGAVLFYRFSASAPRVTLAPTINGQGAMFTLSGSM
jgi:hypothetical protein